MTEIQKIAIPHSGYLRIKVIPKSSKTELVEIMQDPTEDGMAETFKIRIKAAPEKGKANTELIKFLSKELNVDKAQISIICGKSERLKLVKIAHQT